MNKKIGFVSSEKPEAKKSLQILKKLYKSVAPEKAEVIVALGGDGTILSAARAVGPRKTPIVGIHLGELGFLAEVTVEEMFNRLNQIINGDFLVNNRMVL